MIRPLNDAQRLYDLVRAQRITLYQSGYITDAEFMQLNLKNEQSVQRLSTEQTEIRPIAPLEDTKA